MPSKPTPKRLTKRIKPRLNITLDHATLDRIQAVQEALNLDSFSATIRYVFGQFRPPQKKS